MNSTNSKQQQRRVDAKTTPEPNAMSMGTFRVNYILNQAQKWFEALPPLAKLFVVLL